MNISPDEFMSLQGGMSAKDVEIARLKDQVVQLTKERDQWQMRAMETGTKVPSRSTGRCRFIVIPVQKLKAVLSKIHDFKLLGAIGLILQKSLPDNATAEECQAIAEIVPIPQLPNLTLTPEGDVNIEGDWNDVHDNETVNF